MSWKKRNDHRDRPIRYIFSYYAYIDNKLSFLLCFYIIVGLRLFRIPSGKTLLTVLRNLKRMLNKEFELSFLLPLGCFPLEDILSYKLLDAFVYPAEITQANIQSQIGRWQEAPKTIKYSRRQGRQYCGLLQFYKGETCRVVVCPC